MSRHACYYCTFNPAAKDSNHKAIFCPNPPAQRSVTQQKPRGPTLTEISYALPEIDFEIMKSEALEIRNHFHFKIYSVKSRKLLHTLRDHN